MKYIFSILTIFSFTCLHAQFNLVWNKQMAGSQNETLISSTIDPTGDVVSTGSFEGTIDFDPGPAILNITAVGFADRFISKLDASGNLLWVKTIGNPGSFFTSMAVTTDKFGNIYTTGDFYGTADFDPGVGVFNLTSNVYEIYITKTDASGNFVWAKKMDGGDLSVGYSLTVDPAGNVFTTGIFMYGMVDFDPGPGIFFLNAPWEAVFVSKLNADGDFVWAKSFAEGSAEVNTGFSIAVDLFGNIYTAGQFIGPADFDPGPAVYYLPFVNQIDGFVTKWDAVGNFLWAKNISSVGQDWASSVAVDNGGNVFITGSYSGTASIIGVPVTAAGGTDVFITKLNSAGNSQWVRSFGGFQNDFGMAFILDNSNIYTTGAFGDVVDFDPGPTNYPLTSVGASDVFVSKLNSGGNFISAASFGGAGVESGSSISLSPSSEVVISGYFNGTADFDPSGNAALLTSAAASDLFIVKLNQNAVLPVTITNISGDQKNSGILIKWSVEQQLNIEKYEIERSKDGQFFSTIGTVKARGNTNLIAAYDYFDSTPFQGKNYYRLKIIEPGKLTYSTIVKVIVRNTDKATIRIYPNPVAGNSASLETKLSKGTYVVTITNSVGQQLSKCVLNHNGGLLFKMVEFPKNIPAGIYYINIKGEGIDFSSSLIKQ